MNTSETLSVCTIENGRIDKDLPCTCGYNLRTLLPSGRCPECGKSVRKAVQEYRFRNLDCNDPANAKRLLMRVYLCTWLACGVFACLWAAEATTLNSLTKLITGLAVVGVCVSTVLLFCHGYEIVVLATWREWHEASDLAWRLFLNPVLGGTILVFVIAVIQTQL